MMTLIKKISFFLLIASSWALLVITIASQFIDDTISSFYFDLPILVLVYTAVCLLLLCLMVFGEHIIDALNTFHKERKVLSWSLPLLFFCGLIVMALYSFIPFSQELYLKILPIILPIIIVAILIGSILFIPLLKSHKIALPKKIPTNASVFLRYNTIIFFVLVGVSFLLRLIQLGALGYSTDEGSTALYSYYINNTGLPCGDDICYYRGIPYLYFVSFFTQIFGVTEFWVRFPGVVLSIILAIVLYFFIKKVYSNPHIALLSSTLVLFADWNFMLGRYARMYCMFALFVLLSVWLYHLVFREKKYKYYILLLGSVTAAIFLHQFGMLLGFFIIEPFFSRKFSQYKNILFIIFIFAILGLTYYIFSGFLGRFFTSDAYVSLYTYYPTKFYTSSGWFVHRFGLPDWTALKYLFKFFPVAFILLTSYLLASLTSFKKNYNSVLIFCLSIIFSMAVFKFDLAFKYIWWVLVLLYIPLGIALYHLLKRYKKITTVLILLLLLESSVGIHHILTRDYGQSETSYPMLMSTHVEEYHPDDKTIVEYVVEHADAEDIIITDYWIQDVYLTLALQRKSDYFISKLDEYEFLLRFPYYRLVKQDDSWLLTTSGPEMITTVDEVRTALNAHRDKTIWYISSVDFDQSIHRNVSNKKAYKYISERYKTEIVYTGKDGNSRVYILNQPSIED